MTDDIGQEFKRKGILSGRTYLFKVEEALSIIAKCERTRRSIYGIDVLVVTDKTTQVVDYIDYSAPTYSKFDEAEHFEKHYIGKGNNEGHWAEARQFITNRMNKGFFFDIVHE